jgi:sugar lactone lactonase YvrE
MHFYSISGKVQLAMLGSVLALTAACKKDADIGAGTSTTLPQIINFVQPNLYPEGTQYDNQSGRFLVSSQTAGRIGQVTGDSIDKSSTYTYSTFADDNRLVSTIGLNLDASRNRLLAAVSDPGYNQARTSLATKGKLAATAIFNRSTGTLMQFINLGAVSSNTYTAHFANDITIDAQGNAYVTDSYAPIIYKITFDALGMGTASVFLADSALSAPAGKFGLNGIVYHPSGYLLVAKSDEGKLLKIPIITVAGSTTTMPGTLTTVMLPTTGLDLSGDDGLQLLNNTTLLVVCNAQGKVYRVTSANDFGSITATGTFTASTGGVSPYPTTLARRVTSGPGTTIPVDASYVLYSHLDSLQVPKNPAVSRFTLKQVRF